MPICHGSLDGNPITLHTRWKRKDPRYDSVIADNIKMTRCRDINTNFKLNNNLVSKKKGEEGYDPCNKYDMIFEVLINNMNYVTEKADKDCCFDESSWGFAGFSGETGGRLIGKPVSKGTHTTSFTVYCTSSTID